MGPLERGHPPDRAVRDRKHKVHTQATTVDIRTDYLSYPACQPAYTICTGERRPREYFISEKALSHFNEASHFRRERAGRDKTRKPSPKDEDDMFTADPLTNVATDESIAAMCIREVNDQSVLQFTIPFKVCFALHRHTSRVIHRIE